MRNIGSRRTEVLCGLRCADLGFGVYGPDAATYVNRNGR